MTTTYTIEWAQCGMGKAEATHGDLKVMVGWQRDGTTVFFTSHKALMATRPELAAKIKADVAILATTV